MHGNLQGTSGNPVYALASSNALDSVSTFGSSWSGYNADGSSLDSALLDEVTTSVDAAVSAGLSASPDVALRTTIASGVNYSSLNAERQLLVDFLVSSEPWRVVALVVCPTSLALLSRSST